MTQFLNDLSCTLPSIYNVVNGRLIANPRAVALEEQWNNIVRFIFMWCSGIRSRGDDQWVVVGCKEGQSFIRGVDKGNPAFICGEEHTRRWQIRHDGGSGSGPWLGP